MQTSATQPYPAAVPDELERVFREHHGSIYRAAYRITGCAADAEDVLQTVFLRLVRRQDTSIQHGPAASRYLYRAAVNAGLDLLRSRRRSRAREAKEYADSEEASPPMQGRVELREQLREALKVLSPKAAEVFTLRYVEGHGNQDISKMLGISRATIAVTLHRARKRLQRELSTVTGAMS